ncbi:MAG: DUF4349 domain-containing protein [Anaerolineales bacterium]|nr:DUF4349 domain-containing protein [Anaerolineales bacterium]
MRKLLILSLLAFVALLFTACSAAGVREAPLVAPEPVMVERAAEVEEIEASDARIVSSAELQQVDPLVIRNADMAVVVFDPAETAETIGSMAEEMGGFVVSSNVFQTSYDGGETTRASVIIRVPAERLNEAIDLIREEAVEVQRLSIEGQDVTQEYIDLQSRMRNLEAEEAQLLEILDSAEETEDILIISDHLWRVREEIEVLEGRIRYLEDSARLSMISVDIIPDEIAQPLQIGGWQPVGTARDAVETLYATLEFLGDAFIWLVICVLPILLILGVPAYFVIRAIIRRSSRKATEKEAESES